MSKVVLQGATVGAAIVLSILALGIARDYVDQERALILGQNRKGVVVFDRRTAFIFTTPLPNDEDDSMAHEPKPFVDDSKQGL